ncbi:MAG TPA: DUF2505 domain-containing protein [Acidimicrobiales bacterium]|nr:DUF2505 domain-containing protein [Acidimicrobiales bacterium]
MRFRLEQRFAAPLDDVEAAFVDPALLAELATSPELGRPVLLEHDDAGHSVSQQIRYTFTGELSPAVTSVVDPKRLTWVEHSELDRRTHRSVFRIRPDHYPDRLSCSGTISLDPADGGTRRTIEGDLRVRFPLVGSKVERAIVSGLRDHASAEARVVQAWLDRG